MLLRSNGMYAFIVVLILLLAYRYNQKKRIISFSMIAFATVVILKGPVLDYYNVTQPDTVESLSVPLQQIARYICEDGAIEEEAYEFLNRMMDVDQVDEKYEEWLSDPIKNLVRESNGNNIINNKMTFLKVWMGLGIKQSVSYIRARVDLTQAYLNSAYPNGMIFYNGVVENDYGIITETKSGLLNSLVIKTEEAMRGEIIVATGLCFWIYIIGFGFSIMRGEKHIWNVCRF